MIIHRLIIIFKSTRGTLSYVEVVWLSLKNAILYLKGRKAPKGNITEEQILQRPQATVKLITQSRIMRK